MPLPEVPAVDRPEPAACPAAYTPALRVLRKEVVTAVPGEPAPGWEASEVPGEAAPEFQEAPG